MRWRIRGRSAAIAAVGLSLAVAGGGSALGALNFVTVWGSSGTGDGQFQLPQGIALDGAGNVYVADQNNSRIQKFDPNGGFLLKFGSFGSNNGQLGSPKDVAVDGAGTIYVADSGNYRVGKFAPDGTFIQQIGVGQFASNPQFVTVAPNGDIYATEPNAVHEFTASGTLVRSWGTQGTGPGQFNAARGIVADGAGNIYVADASNSTIQKFSSDGTFLSSFGSLGNGPGQLGSPYGLTIGPNGHIFVADNNSYGIVEFAADGTWIQRDDNAQGQSFRPDGIAMNGAGDLYIADDQANTGNRIFKVHPVAAAPPPPAGLPAPQAGVNVNVAVQSGTVLVKLPAGAHLRAGASAAAVGGFVKLVSPAQIPIGSLVDTTHGTIGMTAAAGTAGGLANGSFKFGQFKVVQKRAASAITELQLSQPLSCKKAKGAAAVHAAARSRRLFGSVKGRFRTRGRYSSATVRGTQWLTKDTCTSTLTRVSQGTVVVRDFVKRKNVTVRKGGKYLARKR